MRSRCVAFALDLVRQGHVTIQLTFPIICTMRAMSVRLYVSYQTFPNFHFICKNYGKQVITMACHAFDFEKVMVIALLVPEIGKVNCIVT